MTESFLERKNRQTKEWMARHPERSIGLWRNANSRRWAEDPVKMFHSGLKNRANRKGYLCLSLLELRDMMAPMRCQQTGIELTWNRSGQGFHSPWAPSIDRIDSSKGYEYENVQLVCWLYNSAKNTWTDDDVLKMARALCSQKPA